MYIHKYAYIMVVMCSKVCRNLKNTWDLNCICKEDVIVIITTVGNCLTAVVNSITIIFNSYIITIINNSYYLFCVTE